MEISKTTTLRINNIFETGHEIRLNAIGKVLDPMININSNWKYQLEDEINEYISDKFESEEWSWVNMRLTIGDYMIEDGNYMRNKAFNFYIKLYNAVRDGLLKHMPILYDALLDLDSVAEVDKFNEDVHNYCTGLIDHMLDFDLVDEFVEITST